MLVKRRIKTFIQGDFANRQTARLMADHPSGRFAVVERIGDAEVIVWTGGQDINPNIYQSKVLPGTHFSERRDFFDLSAVKVARSLKAQMIGICRGAQLLNCVHPNTGRLWQDVKGHGLGYFNTHTVRDKKTGKHHMVNSVHHQMMIPGAAGEVVAFCTKALKKESIETVWRRDDMMYKEDDPEWKKHIEDPEVVVYPESSTLCVQFHPEGGHLDSQSYFYELLDRYTLKWADN